MSEQIMLSIQRRKNADGKKCIAPFIGKYNVWDIPEKQWTTEVQQAILSAYDLGYKAAVMEIRELQSGLRFTDPKWEERA